MKEKRNELWKLDILEAKYTQATPRFSFTKKLINARNNSHLMKKLPSTPNEAFQQIHALKADLFRKKYHGSYKKLSRDVSRATKQKQKSTGEKINKSKHLEKLLQSAEFHEQFITAKLVKIIQSAILTTKETRQNPPTFVSEEVREYISDKSLLKNPSRFFITYCQNDKVVNDYVSKLWNLKDMKTLCLEIEWTFRKIRGNLTKDELALRSKETGKNTKNVTEDADLDGSDDSEESESEDESPEIDPEEAFEKFSAYDNLVAGSDDEQEFVADPNIDYNEITDEEMSENDSEDLDSSEKTKPKPKASTEKKSVLPQLATGYFSGGSDDEDDDEDVDNDKIVKEATTTRKNRRGQRARQKIWEQKYGQKAVHVQKEQQRFVSERETKQKEFEERQRKRELKAKLAQETNTSKTAGSTLSSILGDSLKVHPSWEAKKLAEEKMKNVKFAGKKITFD